MERSLFEEATFREDFYNSSILDWWGVFDHSKKLQLDYFDSDPKNTKISFLSTYGLSSFSINDLLNFKQPPLFSAKFKFPEPALANGEYRKCLMEYFMALSNVADKPINLWMRNQRTRLRRFLFRAEPKMTPESRLKRMDDTLTSLIPILSNDPNINQVRLFGSFASRNPYASDIDLAIIVNERISQFSEEEPDNKFSLIENFGDTPPDSPFDEGWEPFPISRYIKPDTFKCIEDLSKKSGESLQILILTKERFNNVKLWKTQSKLISDWHTRPFLYCST